MSELYDILDALSELVYLADPETYELLYVNEPGLKLFQLDDYSGKKCYKMLQGLDAPCPFCTNHLLQTDRFYTWEIQNPIVNRHYILRDKLVPWKDGRTARMEIAFDNTAEMEQRTALQTMLDTETILVDCLRELHRPGDIHTSVQNILAMAGAFLQAERVYIFSIHGEHMSNTYEWCASGVAAAISTLQDMDISLLGTWVSDFTAGRCHVIRNLADIRESSPEEFAILHAQDICTLIAAPMESGGQLIGYIGVDNPPLEKLMVSEGFFLSLSFFLTSALEKQRQEDKLKEMSYLDYLTGLNNRNRFLMDVQLLQQADCHNLGVVYTDLNGLKELNDQHGHTAGDRALCDVSSLLGQVFGLAHCYRLGGDEFIAMLTPVAEPAFYSMVAQLQALLEKNELSCAVGLRYCADCGNVEMLVREADELMYSAKKNFYRGRQSSPRYRSKTDPVNLFSMDETLTTLLETGRFRLYFQPSVGIADNCCKAGEALVRFEDDDGALLLPGDFIPRLERDNTVHLLDFFVLRSVFVLLTERLAAQLPVVPLSINLSRKTMAQENFLPDLDALRSQFPLPTHLLQLEIHDSTDATNDVSALLVTLTELRQRGFHLIIDDFGSLYANLHLFSSARFDSLKLDRSLILNSNASRMKSSIIRSVTQVCHDMDISVVAKGVQNESERTVLVEMGCDQYQGFLFGQPLPAEEFWKKYLP